MKNSFLVLVPVTAVFLSLTAVAETSVPEKAPVSSSNSVAVSNSATGPKIEEVVFTKGIVKLTLPVNSSSALADSWPKALGPLDTHLQDSYSSNCKELSYRAMTDQLEYPIHSSEIPELDQLMKSSDRSMVKSARCAKPKIRKNASGFTQAKGAVRFTVKKPSSFEQADRRLYRISMPWKKTSSWGTGAGDAKLYKSACDVQNEAAGSTVLVSCPEPEMTVACCGNAALTGSMNAYVYAYSKNKLKSVIFTADSQLEVVAKGTEYLAKKAKALNRDLAFSICTPPNWEYSPVMAYQSTCYTLEHAYVAADPTLQFCSGNATADTKVWILLKHDSVEKRDYISATVLSPQLQSGSGDYITQVQKNTQAVFKSDKGALLTIAGTTATLVDGNKLDEKLPASAVSLNCK